MLTKKQVERLNNRFNSLTKAEKRIEIAKDVLSMISDKRKTIVRGIYLNIYNEDILGGSAQKYVDEISCECCALGACLLSATKYMNQLTIGEIHFVNSENSDVWGILNKVFSAKQLGLIEYAFEGSFDGTRVSMDSFSFYNEDIDIKSAVMFGRGYENDEERLTAIMENIIKNRGTFNPLK